MSMSEQSKTEKGNLPVFRSPSFLLTLGAFAFPLPFFLTGQAAAISLAFYLFVSLLEVVALYYLERSRLRGSISRRRFLFLNYLVRSIVGLPLSVYFTALSQTGIPGIGRFFFSAAALMEKGSLVHGILFSIFFSAGLLLFTGIKDSSFPEARTYELAAFSLVLSLLLLAGNLRDRALRKNRAVEKRKSAALGRLLAARDQAIDEMRIDSVPSLAKEIGSGENLPLSGSFLVLKFEFPGLNDSALSFLEAVDYASFADAVRDFHLEWQRYAAYLRKELLAKGFWTGALNGQGMAALQLRDSSADRWEETGGLLLELLHFSDVCQRRLLQRGRRGWGIRICAHAGSVVLTSDGTVAGCVPVGRILDELRDFQEKKTGPGLYLHRSISGHFQKNLQLLPAILDFDEGRVLVRPSNVLLKGNP